MSACVESFFVRNKHRNDADTKQTAARRMEKIGQNALSWVDHGEEIEPQTF